MKPMLLGKYDSSKDYLGWDTLTGVVTELSYDTRGIPVSVTIDGLKCMLSRLNFDERVRLALNASDILGAKADYTKLADTNRHPTFVRMRWDL